MNLMKFSKTTPAKAQQASTTRSSSSSSSSSSSNCFGIFSNSGENFGTSIAKPALVLQLKRRCSLVSCFKNVENHHQQYDEKCQERHRTL
ncbi:Tuberculosinyl adenosine transferase [Trichinella pseudospiralis]